VLYLDLDGSSGQRHLRPRCGDAAAPGQRAHRCVRPTTCGGARAATSSRCLRRRPGRRPGDRARLVEVMAKPPPVESTDPGGLSVGVALHLPANPEAVHGRLVEAATAPSTTPSRRQPLRTASFPTHPGLQSPPQKMECPVSMMHIAGDRRVRPDPDAAPGDHHGRPRAGCRVGRC
jgi:hypothetical protein